MRVTGNFPINTLVNQLNTLAARQFQLQNQASTGQRIQAPEDDPAAMARAMNLQAEGSRVAQYAQTINTLQTRSTSSGNVLQELKTISDRVSELVIQGGDPTKSPSDLHGIATEITGLIKQAAQIMNSKNGDQYLFGGTLSGQPPFTVSTDANGNVTAVTYQGNTSVAQNEIAENTNVSVDVPGENSTGTGPRGVISDSRFGADFFNHLISLQNDLLAGNSGAVANNDKPALLKDEDNIIYQIANNGTTQARLEMAAAMIDNRKTGLQQTITKVAGADLTQTLAQLSQTQTAYQVALQSSSTILQLQQSLLSYLP